MSQVFDAYDLHIENLKDSYLRLNQAITYPDGMSTSLGILYWGRETHLGEIERAIPKFRKNGIFRFNKAYLAMKTPAKLKKLAEQTGIPMEILRILRHDMELWLPKSVSLPQLEMFLNKPGSMRTLSEMGLDDQLAVISAGQNPELRKNLALQTRLDIKTLNEIVKLCDFFRTGKNLDHIRAKVYFAMGMDTWQKWAGQTSEGIISMFAAYIKENQLEGGLLIPWPKEVRNGIEWAKMHLEMYSVQW